MKLRNAFLVGVFIFVALVDCVFPLPGDAGDEFQLWWQVEMTMSVSGSYRYTHNNNDYQGRYAFDVVAAASMDLDSSKDFILYPGETKIIDLDWKEAGKNLSEKMEPGVRMSYVLKERGKVYFDLEIFLNAIPPEMPASYKDFFLLPRSALNKTINPRDKYNKHIIAGSNRVQLPAKLLLKQIETRKEFNWKWKREKSGFANSHSVALKLKVTRKERKEQ